MRDLISLFDFLIDVVCMMPPIDAAPIARLPREYPIVVCLGSVALLSFYIVVKGFLDFFNGNKFIAIIISACIILLSFASVPRSVLEDIFIIAYPPMVIALRGAEGALIGLSTSRKAWFLILPVFIVCLIILYFALRPIPTEELSIGKAIWAFAGAAFASFRWSRIISNAENTILASPFSTFLIFIIFVSTILYVSGSKIDLLFFKFTFPIGLIIGIIFSGTIDEKIVIEDPNQAISADTKSRTAD